MNSPKLKLDLATYVKPGTTVVVGVSGGPDSTALLVLLDQYAQLHDVKIIVAHVNHGIRGKAADRDEKFVHKLARKCGAMFESMRVQLSGSGVEEQGRTLRRDFFIELQAQNKADWILTAHTMDDQVETMMFRIIRGTGIGGLAGIPFVEGKFLRPLLNTTKKEILAFLKSEKQKFCLDATNNDSVYTRNFIRNKIVPLCEKLNPSYRDAFVRLSKIAKETQDWIEKEAEEFIKKCVKKNSIPVRELQKIGQPLQAAVVNNVYQEVAGAFYHLPQDQIERILGMLQKNVGNKKVIYQRVSFSLNKGLMSITK